MIQTFDLEKVNGDRLETLNHANLAPGIKRKQVGVIWEDPEVLGIGGKESKVRHFMRHPPRSLGLCSLDLHLCVCR